MAKGDVVLKFDAQTAAAVQEIAKLLEKVKAGADGVNKFGQSFAKAGDHADAFTHKIKDGMTELAGLIAVPTTILAGFEAAMKAIEHRIELAEQRTHALLIRSATFGNAMYTLGTQESASEIRERLEARTKLGFGATHPAPGETESMYAKIVASVGPRASTQQFEAATTTAMQGKARGADDTQAVQIGSSMAIIQAMAPDLSENEADQLARFFQQNAPGVLEDEKLLGAVLRQKPENRQRAMGMAAAMYQGHQPLKQAQRLFDMVSQGRATFDRILENPDSLPLQERFIARAVREGASKLKPVGSREEALAAVIKGSDPTSRASAVMKNVEALGEIFLEEGAPADAIERAIVKRAEQIYEKSNPSFSGLIPRKMFEFPIREQTEAGHGAMGDTLFPSDARAKAQIEVRNYLKEQTELLRGIHSNTGGGPTLNNDSEGQK